MSSWEEDGRTPDVAAQAAGAEREEERRRADEERRRAEQAEARVLDLEARVRALVEMMRSRQE